MNNQFLSEKFKELSQKEMISFLFEAAKIGTLAEFKIILNSPQIQQMKNTSVIKNSSFKNACRVGNIEIIKYLLTSPELDKHVNIHNDEDEALQVACLTGNLDVVKYLLTSPDLKEKADLHAEKDNSFKFAVSQEQWEVINFLIFDMNIEKTSYINDYLNKIEATKVKNMFESRELNKKLDSELSNNQINKKKNKL